MKNRLELNIRIFFEKENVKIYFIEKQLWSYKFNLKNNSNKKNWKTIKLFETIDKNW